VKGDVKPADNERVSGPEHIEQPLHVGIPDIAIASTLAVGRFAMRPLPASLVAGTLAAAAALAFVLDFMKVPVFAGLRIT
jgi:hypothetical protein